MADSCMSTITTMATEVQSTRNLPGFDHFIKHLLKDFRTDSQRIGWLYLRVVVGFFTVVELSARFIVVLEARIFWKV